MPVPAPTVELLFAVPRRELFTRISALIGTAQTFSAVVGFLTEEGVALIEDALASRPTVLTGLVVGATTLKACDGLDRLRSAGVPPDRLRIHLGHSRSTKGGFVKYHPMMHSKVYLFEGNDRSTAIVGSHNMTGFAMGGQNTEASVLVETDRDGPLMQEVRDHIAAARSESIPYDPGMRLAYAWWFRQLLVGMERKVLYGDGEEDIEYRRNVVAIGVRVEERLPVRGEVVYFEVPAAFRALNALGDPVHFYLLSQRPNTVKEALKMLPSCEIAFRGNVVGTNEGVVREGEAQWRIRDLRNPLLESTTGRVSPTTAPGEVQAFVEITDVLTARYDYVFDPHKTWLPVYDESQKGTIIAAEGVRNRFENLELIPSEHLPWHRVIGLKQDLPEDRTGASKREVSPESGRFVLLSMGRRLLRTTTPVVEAPSPSSRPASPFDSIPSAVWFAASKWAKDNQALQNWQRRIAYSLGGLSSKGTRASEKQTKQGTLLLLEAVGLGFTHEQLTPEMVNALRSQEV
jgi:hypothetical protein